MSSPTHPAQGLFIAGTDTGVGKTIITLGLMARLQSLGLTVCGMKPVASGCEPTPAGLRNADAEGILAQSSRPLSYPLVNPYAFEPAIAPHLAAEEVGVTISLDVIEQAYRNLLDGFDVCLVEGIGGWMVPLGSNITTADLVQQLQLPVVLVVGVRLGCLNHALLSAESILNRQVSLLGWVASVVDSTTARVEGNVTALSERIPAPLLGVVPWLRDPISSAVAKCLTGVDAAITISNELQPRG